MTHQEDNGVIKDQLFYLQFLNGVRFFTQNSFDLIFYNTDNLEEEKEESKIINSAICFMFETMHNYDRHQ